VVDVVSSECHVNGGVDLDARDFGATQLLHGVDVMDVVIFDHGENCAHATYDTGLLAVVNMAAAHDMRADFFFEPAVVLTAANGVTLHLCGAF